MFSWVEKVWENKKAELLEEVCSKIIDLFLTVPPAFMDLARILELILDNVGITPMTEQISNVLK